MKHIIFGVSLILIGSFVIIVRAKFARVAVNFQNKTFGFHLGEADVRGNMYVIIIVGIVTIILGVLTIMGVIDPK